MLVSPYQFFVLFFALLYCLFFFFKLKNVKEQATFNASKWSQKAHVCILLVVLVLPWIIFAVLNPVDFRNADIKMNMADSQIILQQGRIQSSSMLENDYYHFFPIFTLLISSISSVTRLTSLQAVHVLNVVIQVLFWLLVWVLLFRNSTGKLKHHFILLGIVTATYANPYLYGYFNTPLPQTMGLCVLLLLLIMSLSINNKSYALIYVIILTVGLVHVSILPIFLLSLVILFLSTELVKKQAVISLPQKLRYMTPLPIVLLFAYVFNTVAAYPVVGYLQKILSYLSDLANDALSGQISTAEGLPRGALYPLNALGPALIIGATAAFLILQFQAVHRQQETNNWLSMLAVLSLILIFLGTLRGQFDVWGQAFGSISRYFNLPGYALTTVVASWTIANSFQRERKKWVLTVLLLVVVILPSIGGLLDPLAF
jgi:hypothetical protein